MTRGEREPASKPEPMSGRAVRRPFEVYGFDEQERTVWRIKQERFQEIVSDELTLIHEIRPSTNQFGEFMFVTTSKPGDDGRVSMVFYGLGYHQHRERWIEDEWYWYQGRLTPELARENIAVDEAVEQFQERRDELRPEFAGREQTVRGQLFELLAELTDEDAALAELQDIEDVAGALSRLSMEETGQDSSKQEEEEKALFPLGQVFATPGALAALEQAGQLPEKFLHQHQAGDWGEVPEEDRIENDLSVKKGFRLLSAYPLKSGVWIWIISEWDRSATTILLPDEY